MKQVEFYFDLGSPYSYLAYHRLKAIAAEHQAEIVYRPILLGGIFKATGNHSPIEIPAKGFYSMIDMQRWAEAYQIPMQMNSAFPLNTLSLMRILTGYQLHHPEQFEDLLTVLFDGMFKQAKNLANIEILTEWLTEHGYAANDIFMLILQDDVKKALIQETELAVQRGVFGAPTFFIENEMFWGQDRLNFVEARLQKNAKPL